MNSPFRSNSRAISTEVGLKAAKIAIQKAIEKKVKCILCGGLAMHLFGFTRATSDIDFIADGEIDLQGIKNLTFGGKAYSVTIDGIDVEIDWILRNDEKKTVYDAALNHLVHTDDGLPVLSPEFMVIVKHLAGRGKDHIDCLWLLRQPDLVDRSKIFSILGDLMGPYAFWAIEDIKSLILEADMMKARDEQGE